MQQISCLRESNSWPSDEGLFELTTAPSSYIMGVDCTLGIWAECLRRQVKKLNVGWLSLLSSHTKRPPCAPPSFASKEGIQILAKIPKENWTYWPEQGRRSNARAQFEPPTWQLTIGPVNHWTTARSRSCCFPLCAWRSSFAVWRSLSVTGRLLSVLIGLVNSPSDVLTTATGAKPSWRIFTCTTRPKLHCSGGTSTTSSTERFWHSCRHLPRGWFDATFSVDHRFQNWESSWRARNRFIGPASVFCKQSCGVASNKPQLTSIDDVSERKDVIWIVCERHQGATAG